MPRDYEELARELQTAGLLSDPWFMGEPRLSPDPLLLSKRELAALYEAAEGIALAFQELCVWAEANTEEAEDFLGLTPYQRLMWRSSAPYWHGMARADVFLTEQGHSICELNCDTPSGQPEAVLLNAVIQREHPDHTDPNESLQQRFVGLIEAFAQRGLHRTKELQIGIVYPTEHTEDLAMIELYRRWLSARGHHVTLGSPYNLRATSTGGVALFAQPCDVIYRHYKTDWWGERLPVYTDQEDFPDPEPLDGPLGLLVRASLLGRCVVVNPLGAVLPQNKRAMALLWERRDMLSAPARHAVEAHLPRTYRVEDYPLEQLLREREEWVVKSDYGCEGDEVIIGKECSEDEWAEALRCLIKERWIAQRYFEAKASPDGVANFGVYLIAGLACGVLVRVSQSHTDVSAKITPILIKDEPVPL
jgi:glutathionylspermidine synthase